MVTVTLVDCELRCRSDFRARLWPLAVHTAESLEPQSATVSFAQQAAAFFWQQPACCSSRTMNPGTVHSPVCRKLLSAASSTKGVGSTSCASAQASFSSLEKQQQCALQPAASWQPQERSMQGKGILRSFERLTGKGTPAAETKNASPAAANRPPRNARTVILRSRRKCTLTQTKGQDRWYSPRQKDNRRNLSRQTDGPFGRWDKAIWPSADRRGSNSCGIAAVGCEPVNVAVGGIDTAEGGCATWSQARWSHRTPIRCHRELKGGPRPSPIHRPEASFHGSHTAANHSDQRDIPPHGRVRWRSSP
jgi:hypothetical protein